VEEDIEQAQIHRPLLNLSAHRCYPFNCVKISRLQHFPAVSMQIRHSFISARLKTLIASKQDT